MNIYPTLRLSVYTYAA